MSRRPPRRIVVTVCSREDGVVSLPIERGGRTVTLDAVGIARELTTLVEQRGLGDYVRIEEGCAGGCGGAGPNVGVTFFAMPRAGAPPDNIAVGWRTYVDSLASLDCLARILDANLGITRRAPKPAHRSGRRATPGGR